MKILVCVKQIANPETPLEPAPGGKWIQESELTEFRLNRFDEYALEEAMLIKETHPDVTIDAISVGPSRVNEAVKQALSKGADNGIHILRKENGYCPANITAQLIAGYAGLKSYDLILAGVMAEDDMLCQVGPMVASMLSLPCAVSVTSENLDLKSHVIKVDCEMEGGMTEKAILSLPAVLTIQSGINRPRYPSLSNILRANSQELVVMEADYPQKDHVKETLLSLRQPEKTTQTIMFDGTAEEKAEKLVKLFHQKSLLK
jgi:electron transfer flavoprotein beta subunit